MAQTTEMTAALGPGLSRRVKLHTDAQRLRELGSIARMHGLDGLHLRSVDKVSREGREVARLIVAMSPRQRNHLTRLCARGGKIPVVVAVTKVDDLTHLIAVADRLCRAFGLSLDVTGPSEIGYAIRMAGAEKARNRAAQFVAGKWLEIAAVQRARGVLDGSCDACVSVEYEIEFAKGAITRSDFDGVLVHGDTVVFIEAKNRQEMSWQGTGLVDEVSRRLRHVFRWSRRNKVADAGIHPVFVVVGASVDGEVRAAMAERIREKAATATATPRVVVADITTLAGQLKDAISGGAE